MTMQGRSPRESITEKTEIVLPQFTNAIGTAFGGTIMSWADICAAVSAQRHCGRVAVTASVDAFQFLAPIRLGDVVILRSRVNAVFRTSMEVEVTIEREDFFPGGFLQNLPQRGKAPRVPPPSPNASRSRQVSGTLAESLPAEDFDTGTRVLCAVALLTFVNIGEDGRPAPIPPLLLETDDDRRRVEEASKRRQQRLAARNEP